MGTHADKLRDTLVDQLLDAGMVRTPRVEAAMRVVPRHVFLPGVPLSRAYANDVVQTKLDAGGVPISAASQPSIVGTMLDQLAVEPGMRVLEIGAGTGYNAALLSYLTGTGGQVVTVDVDEDIVAGARSALAAAGVTNVTVVRADGALGCPGHAPYDRIIATVGVWDLPLAWQEQLTPQGRIVVPLRLHGGVTRSIAFSRAVADGAGVLRSTSSEMCGFMPLRASIASDPRQAISLTPSGDVTLEVQQDQDADPAALAGVLQAGPPVVAWTGVHLSGMAAADGLYLWLTCTVPGGMFGLSTRPSAVDQGIVAPMFRWGALAAVDSGSLAYLTLGPPSPEPASVAADNGGLPMDRGGQREIGVIGHGPRAAELVAGIVAQTRAWDRDYRLKTPAFTIQPFTDGGGLTEGGGELAGPPETGTRSPGEFVFRTPHNLVTISWHT